MKKYIISLVLGLVSVVLLVTSIVTNDQTYYFIGFTSICISTSFLPELRSYIKLGL